ncbi:MAG: SOS response-associated peptidase family protein [Bdellovibrionales bacterium]|nr:SOS response-associated peptidase family protein [Bdellovibrionales bacterium]
MRYLVVETDLEQLAAEWSAKVNSEAFAELFSARLKNPKIKIPRALEHNFLTDNKFLKLIKEYERLTSAAEREELKMQEKRLKDAESRLKKKPSKTATLEKSRAESKVKKLRWKLGQRGSKELRPYDFRLYPFYFGPLLCMESGQRTLRPSRFHCRPAGQSADFDKKAYSMYKARLESLQPDYFERIRGHSGKESLWRPLFGETHGLLPVKAFFEAVKTGIQGFEIGKANWEPVPCLFDVWKEGKSSLHSFAIITGPANAAVRAGGYDRSPAGLEAHRLNEWLLPEGQSDETLLQILRVGASGIGFKLAA